MKVNEFQIGDIVLKKGTTEPIMKINSNAAGLAFFENYIHTSKYVCIWKEGSLTRFAQFDGADLILQLNSESSAQ